MPVDTRYRPPGGIRVIWDGQSHNWLPDGLAAPEQTMARFPGIPWVKIGIGGNGWAMLLDQHPISRLTDQGRRTGVDVLIMNGGQGDIINAVGDGGQHTGAQAYDLAAGYAELARSAGANTVIGIVPPMIGPDVFGTGRPNTFETQALEDLRDLTRTDPDGIYDAIVDCSVAPLDDATNGTWFDIDRTHLTAAGAEAMADLIAPVLAPFLI